MEWSNTMIIDFLGLYEKEDCIWNPSNPLNKDRKEIAAAWLRIRDNMTTRCTVEQLKKKKDSLMASFRLHINKRKKSIMSKGGNNENVYKPGWFAYKKMARFLEQFYLQEINTEESNDDQEEDDNYEEEREMEIDIKHNDVNKLGSIYAEPVPRARSTRESNAHKRESNHQSRRARTPPLPIKNLATPELVTAIVAKKKLDEAFSFLKNESERSNEQKDECDLYGELLAKRLKKMDENLREAVMNEIDNLVYRARSTNDVQGTTSLIIPRKTC